MSHIGKPNILVLVTDQQRFDTLAFAGNSLIHTPNLDRLCLTGVRFNRAYTESPECAPARAAALTGRWGHRTGVLNNGKPLNPDIPTFIEHLTAAGYRSGAVGTIDFKQAGYDSLQAAADLPENLEEDDFLQYLQSAGFGHVHEPHGIRHAYYYIPQVSQLPDQHHVTTWVGDRSIEWIQKDHARQPWLLVSSFMKPHPPFEPTIPYLTLYDPEALPLPVRGAKEDYNGSQLMAKNYFHWMESADDNLTRLIKSAYYACITQIDVQIGRILDALEQQGLREQTLILFLSDHGEMLGDHYQWGKGCFYEGAARIPFILSWPGTLPEGEVREHLVGHRDIAPTLLHAAGLTEFTEGMAGVNLFPIAIDAAVPGREVTFGEYSTGLSAQYMALNGEWKYMYSPNGGSEKLFHLRTDLFELKDRAADPAAREPGQALRKELIRFFQKDGYTEALSPEGDDLLKLPYQELMGTRGRQYARWKKETAPDVSNLAYGHSRRIET